MAPPKLTLLLALLAAAPLTAQVAWLESGPMEIPAQLHTTSGYQFMMASHHPQQGYLGVGLRDLTDDQLAVLRLKDNRGAEIITVDHDAPAGKVGLRVNDVILQVDAAVIQNAEEFSRIMRETPAGHTLSLLISRAGQQLTIAVTLANRTDVERNAWGHHYVPGPPPGYEDQPPPPDAMAPGGPVPNNGYAAAGSAAPMQPPPGDATHSFFSSPFTGDRKTYTGAMLEPVGQLADFFGVKPGLGLLVKNIDPDSPAIAAGLKPGDVITRVNSTDLYRPDDWFRAIRDSKGRPLQITIIRNKTEQPALTLTPTEYRRRN